MKVGMNLPSSLYKGTRECAEGTNSIRFFGFSMYPVMFPIL